MNKLLISLGLFLCLFTAQLSQAVAYHAEKVLSSDGVVWGFAFLTADELLITLRRGQLLYANLSNDSIRELSHSLEIAAQGQGGLMDVLVQPYEGKELVYLTYATEYRGQLTTALARGVWNGGEVTELKTIFIAHVRGRGVRHFGSRLVFLDGYVFMTIGDRAQRHASQDLALHNGKVLRLEVDGKPAPQNPFTNTTGALPEIWSYGHRNPQGIDVENGSGKLYSIEFGPRGGDELNLIAPRKNYGWPVISQGYEYWGPKFKTHHSGMEQPVVFWTPSISPSGMAFYRGDKLPQWQGNLFVASLGNRHLRRLVLKNNQVITQQVLFADLHERIRQVRSGKDGYLYFSTDSGNIYRVVPAE